MTLTWQGEFLVLKKGSDVGAGLNSSIVQGAVSFTVFVTKGSEVTSQFYVTTAHLKKMYFYNHTAHLFSIYHVWALFQVVYMY